MPTHDDVSSWPEYRALVLDSLERIDKRLDRLDEGIGALKVQLVALQIKAGLWGAMAGALPALLTAGLLWMKGSHAP